MCADGWRSCACCKEKGGGALGWKGGADGGEPEGKAKPLPVRPGGGRPCMVMAPGGMG